MKLNGNCRIAKELFLSNNPINHENDLSNSTPSNQTDPSFGLLWVRMYENDYELYVIVCRSYKDG